MEKVKGLLDLMKSGEFGEDSSFVEDVLQDMIKRATCIARLRGNFDEVYPAVREVFTSLPSVEIVKKGFYDRSILAAWDEETREEERQSAEDEYSYNDYYATMELSEKEVTFYTGTSGREVTIREGYENHEKILIVEVDFRQSGASHHGSVCAAAEVIQYIKYWNPETSATFDPVSYKPYGGVRVRDVVLSRTDLLFLRRGDNAEANSAYNADPGDMDELDSIVGSVMELYVPGWYKEYVREGLLD